MSESIEEVVTIKPGYKLEYTALRAELLKRAELRQQILSITLTLAGVFLGFGLANTAIAFIYPSIAVFLSMLWAQNDLRSSQIGKHLQQMEKVIPGLTWETYYRRELVSAVRIGTWPLSVLAPGGMFLATQIIAIGIGLSKFIREPVEIFLLAMSIFALVVTVSLLIITGREREKYRKL